MEILVFGNWICLLISLTCPFIKKKKPAFLGLKVMIYYWIYLLKKKKACISGNFVVMDVLYFFMVLEVVHSLKKEACILGGV